MKLKKKIGFIGCGNMGKAILAGLLAKGLANPAQIYIYDADSSKVSAVAKKYRIRPLKSNRELAGSSEIVILAVKPQDFTNVAYEIRHVLTTRHVVISILAGTPVTKLKKFLGNRAKILRSMPNLGAQVGEAITIVTGPAKSIRVAKAVFSGCGKVIRLPENKFDWVTAISGSGPAYFFFMMELLSRAAQKAGISRSVANLLAVQTALGAGKLAQSSPRSPEALRHMVTSKKGTTEAALKYLSAKRFDAIFLQALKQAEQRAHQLSKL